MTQGFTRYRLIGHRSVQGWLQPEVLTVLQAIDSAQRASGVTGSVAEIGVHHGKLFIALQLLQRSGERSIAIDVFGDQDLNIDNSGKGDLDIFRTNVQRWSSLDGLSTHQGDSTKLSADALLELTGSPVRLFSVDGGHTEQIVLSDMRLAEASLAEGGVVIADDVFNPQWPGVAVGTLRYLDQGGRLAPFIIAFNKVLFADPEYCSKYRSAVESAFANRRLVETHTSVYDGHDVGVLLRVPRTPRQVLRRSELARSVYHRLIGR
jgi:hypothetical protein